MRHHLFRMPKSWRGRQRSNQSDNWGKDEFNKVQIVVRLVERRLLGFGHAHGHGRQVLHEALAAEHAPAVLHVGQESRLIAHADLPHLDAGAEFGGQFAHEVPEIDAPLGREVEHEPRAVVELLDAREAPPPGAPPTTDPQRERLRAPLDVARIGRVFHNANKID